MKWTRYMPAVISGGVLLLGVAVLRWMGRVWWCVQRDPTFFVSDPSSPHNSQHFFDWYSFSHLLHGVLFFWALWWVAGWLRSGRDRKGKRMTTADKHSRMHWALPVAVLVETAWEVLENSPAVIARYRETAAIGYEGDSIVNSVGDLAFCIAGFYLARAIGWKASVVVFIVLELGMLWLIRDNLTLNVVMLVWPFEAVRRWQMGG